MKKSSKSWLKFQRAVCGGITVWRLGWNGLLRAAWTECGSRSWRETGSVIKPACMIVHGRGDICQFEWYRDNKELLPSQALAWGGFLFYTKFLRIPYKIKSNYRGVCPSEARVLRQKRNMPRKRPAAGGESYKAGFFVLCFKQQALQSRHNLLFSLVSIK